eukprot:scaffold58773_cov18-Tisochrysis_lutea.AAC.1
MRLQSTTVDDDEGKCPGLRLRLHARCILQHQAHPLNAQPAWHSMLTGIQLSKPRRISPEKLFLHPRHEYNLEGRDWGSRSLGRALAHILIFALA